MHSKYTDDEQTAQNQNSLRCDSQTVLVLCCLLWAVNERVLCYKGLTNTKPKQPASYRLLWFYAVASPIKFYAGKVAHKFYWSLLYFPDKLKVGDICFCLIPEGSWCFTVTMKTCFSIDQTEEIVFCAFFSPKFFFCLAL